MSILPHGISNIWEQFSSLFTSPTRRHLQVLLIGSILCQGARRVSSILRVMGLYQEKRFEKYHRVLNRAQWNGLMGAKILLGLLVSLLPPNVPLLIAVDDTLERRKGKHIRAKGYYRDACLSTENNVVSCLGLKWLCFMLIVPLPWCQRPWALPFMTLLMPSKEYNIAQSRLHKTPIDWTLIGLRIITRWLKRSWVLIGDGSFACVRLGHACIQQKITLIARLRLDVVLHHFPKLPQGNQKGRPREKGAKAIPIHQLAQDKTQPWCINQILWYGLEKKTVHLLSGTHLWYSAGAGKPLPIRWVLVHNPTTNKTEAFFSTDLQLSAEKIVTYFVLRWNQEVTFEEARAHLGIETQRQWSDKAIARTTPLLMALFSLICLFAHEMLKTQSLPILSTAWYNKKGQATFSDILAFVKRALWVSQYTKKSQIQAGYVKIKLSQWDSLLNQLSWAA